MEGLHNEYNKTICDDFKIWITSSTIAHQSKSTYLEVIIIPVQTPKNYAEPSTCLFIIEHAKEVTLHKKKKQPQQKTKESTEFTGW